MFCFKSAFTFRRSQTRKHRASRLVASKNNIFSNHTTTSTQLRTSPFARAHARASSRRSNSSVRVDMYAPPPAPSSFRRANTDEVARKLNRMYKHSSKRTRIGVSVSAVCAILCVMKFLITDHDVLFLIAEFVHCVGIGFLAYKLIKHENCAGVSLKSQQLTAMFLGIRLYCSLVMEYDWHTLLDALTLGATLWVCKTMQTTTRATYTAALDETPLALVVGPCVALAIIAHPTTRHAWVNRVAWAICVYLEAVSVLPQLRMMQKARVVERFTANYVFALGVARFFSCAHWILQVFEGTSYLQTALGKGIWPLMVLTSEVVQTGILADFCYYYIQSWATGESSMTLPV